MEFIDLVLLHRESINFSNTFNLDFTTSQSMLNNGVVTQGFEIKPLAGVD